MSTKQNQQRKQNAGISAADWFVAFRTATPRCASRRHIRMSAGSELLNAAGAASLCFCEADRT
jgi:hypothetical protein